MNLNLYLGRPTRAGSRGALAGGGADPQWWPNAGRGIQEQSLWWGSIPIKLEGNPLTLRITRYVESQGI